MVPTAPHPGAEPTETADDAGPRHSPLWAAAYLAILASMWLPRLWSGLWLDETGTYWVVKDGFSDAVERSSLQGQSPLYYIIAWVARVIGGDGEVPLRVPSLLAMVVCTFLLYRLGVRLFERRGALLCVLLFSSTIGIRFAATDARPYALALMALVASSLAFVRWLDRGKVIDAAVWAITAALTIYLTYMFAVALVAHIVLLIVRRRTTPVRPRAMVVGALAVGVLVAPALPQLRSILTRSDILVFVAPPAGMRALVETLFPLTIAFGLAFGVTAFVMTGRLSAVKERTSSALALPVAMWLIPPIVFFLLAQIVSAKFFQARYVLPSAIGTALVFGWVAGAVRPRRAGIVIIATTIAVSFAYRVEGDPHHQDWRAAAHAANATVPGDDTPVLVHTGFATRRAGTDPEAGGLVLAPLAAYPIRGVIIPLPYMAPDDDPLPLPPSVLAQLATADAVVLVSSFSSRYPQLVERLLAPSGFQPTTAYRTRHLEVISYRKTEP